MYHMKYWGVFCQTAATGHMEEGGEKHTCEVQTLLKATKANVCTNIVPGKSLCAPASGTSTALRSICGRNAHLANGISERPAGEDTR